MSPEARRTALVIGVVMVVTSGMMTAFVLGLAAVVGLQPVLFTLILSLSFGAIGAALILLALFLMLRKAN